MVRVLMTQGSWVEKIQEALCGFGARVDILAPEDDLV
jgi:hypothetical protein